MCFPKIKVQSTFLRPVSADKKRVTALNFY